MATRIHLEHPQHGRKIAYIVAEAEADKKNGWKEYTPEPPAPAQETPDEEPAESLNSLGLPPVPPAGILYIYHISFFFICLVQYRVSLYVHSSKNDSVSLTIRHLIG